MPPDSVLVIDAGTSAMRAVLVRDDGVASTVGIAAYRTLYPQDAAPFGCEFDPLELLDSLGRLLSSAQPHREHIAALAFTGQREGVAFLDGEGAALFASPNVDARAAAEGMTIDARYGADVYRATGHLPALLQIPAKLAWMQAWRPQIAARIAYALPLVDWLASSQTGLLAMSRSLGVENGVLDASNADVPVALLATLGLDAAMLPDVVADGSVVGMASGRVPGLPVILAGADTQCALVGMGALSPGDTGIAAGWSAPVQMVTARPVFDDAQRTWTSVHAVPGTWILESNAGEAGRTHDWLRTLLGLTHEDAVTLAQASPPGARDVMCITGARTMTASAMNAGIGAVTFPAPLVVSEPTRGDVLRASLESIACAIRANVEQLEAVAGSPAPTLRLGGGMSRSPLFAEILTDVIDRPVVVAGQPETSAVGAAVLAAAAVGLHLTIADAMQAMARPGTTRAPRLSTAALYDDVYARWSAMAQALPRLATEVG